MELVVSYTFKDIEYINTNDLRIERAIKIYKILNKEYKSFRLTRKELNL
jgi:hypothetical protein